jgi:large conductance mechanosensitive channel
VLKGFKDFILRGNVVDLAVAVIIGAAFSALVKQFGDSFLRPLLDLTGGGSVQGGELTVGNAVFRWGDFLNAVITFLITAATLYFVVVMPLNTLAERRKHGKEPEPQRPAEDILLLQQIRDALVERNNRETARTDGRQSGS